MAQQNYPLPQAQNWDGIIHQDSALILQELKSAIGRETSISAEKIDSLGKAYFDAGNLNPQRNNDGLSFFARCAGLFPDVVKEPGTVQAAILGWLSVFQKISGNKESENTYNLAFSIGYPSFKQSISTQAYKSIKQQDPAPLSFSNPQSYNYRAPFSNPAPQPQKTSGTIMPHQPRMHGVTLPLPIIINLKGKIFNPIGQATFVTSFLDPA